MAPKDEPARSSYRLFWTNKAGRIVGAPVIVKATGDDDALSQATALAQGRSAEIWLGARCVKILDSTGHVAK